MARTSPTGRYLLDALANAPAPDNPLDAASTDELRTHLAVALEHTPQAGDALLLVQVEGALHTLKRRRLERRQRELRAQIAEADRRGDQEITCALVTGRKSKSIASCATINSALLPP